MNQMFDYFYHEEAEQFSFYRIPKILITDDRFRFLSSDAKLLYGLMLDRMSLSMKNHWIDDQGRVYIIFPLLEIMDALHCKHEKGCRLIAELDTERGIGLIDRVKQGMGRPAIIYVKNFLVKDTTSSEDAEDGTSENSEKITALEHGESTGSEDFRKTEVMSSEKQKSRLPKNGSEDFRKTDANKTNKNKTNKSETNNLIHLSDRELDLVKETSSKTDPDGMDRLTEHDSVDSADVIQYQFAIPTENDNTTSRANYVHFEGSCLEATRKEPAGVVQADTDMSPVTEDTIAEPSLKEITALLRANIEYDFLVKCRPEDQHQIDELISLMAEAIFQQKDIKISGATYNYQDVRSRFEKYDSDMMQYVLTSLSQNTTKVKNIKNYLLATLLNAPHTIDNFYALSVSHDLYGDG